MNAKHFLIAHGEKVALSLTVLACALQLTITYSDSSVRPTKVTPADIETKNTAIDSVFARGKPPVLKPVPPYLNDMDQRLAKTAPVIQENAWLSTPPDRGPAAGGLLLYIFELPAPTVEATDVVGHVDLTVTLPETARTAGKRLADGLAANWELTDGVANKAAVLGVLIESHRGDGVFKPLSVKGLENGYVSLATLKDTNNVLRIDGLEPWIKHSFRARLVASATALDLSQPAHSAHSVVVAPGRLVPLDQDPNWTDLTTRIQGGDAATLAKLAKPQPTVPAGVVLGADESLFIGQDSAVADVQVTSDIRFILDKISTDIANPEKELAAFLVTKQFNVDGTKAWLKEPQSFKAGIGDLIGGSVVIETPLSPGRKQNVPLNTGFKVLAIKRAQERILYWEIREKARAGGAKGKDLTVEKKVAQTDLVTVENPRSHAQFTFMKAQQIKPPARADAITYPYLPGPKDEEGEFRADPSSYTQGEQSPAEPKQYQPGSGPLEKLRLAHPDASDLYSTDTPYYELGDGRLVWWDPLNKRVTQDPVPSAKPAAAPAAEGPGGALPPATGPGGNHPAGQPRVPPGVPGATPPGGMPPGGAPTGGMPPGVRPPGGMPGGVHPPGQPGAR